MGIGIGVWTWIRTYTLLFFPIYKIGFRGGIEVENGVCTMKRCLYVFGN